MARSRYRRASIGGSTAIVTDAVTDHVGQQGTDERRRRWGRCSATVAVTAPARLGDIHLQRPRARRPARCGRDRGGAIGGRRWPRARRLACGQLHRQPIACDHGHLHHCRAAACTATAAPAPARPSPGRGRGRVPARSQLVDDRVDHPVEQAADLAGAATGRRPGRPPSGRPARRRAARARTRWWPGPPRRAVSAACARGTRRAGGRCVRSWGLLGTTWDAVGVAHRRSDVRAASSKGPTASSTNDGRVHSTSGRGAAPAAGGRACRPVAGVLAGLVGQPFEHGRQRQAVAVGGGQPVGERVSPRPECCESARSASANRSPSSTLGEHCPKASRRAGVHVAVHGTDGRAPGDGRHGRPARAARCASA